MREIRGAGEQHVEEGGEEEKDFEEDEVIESEAEAVAETKADEGSNEVKTEAAGGDDEKNQNKAKQEEKEDKKNESSSLNKANSTDSFDAQMVLRRIRGKRTVHETPRSQSVRRKLEFSPTSAESAPAMKASPTSATSASGGSKQKQSTLKRFFSSESVGTEELELEEEPQLPPKKREDWGCDQIIAASGHSQQGWASGSVDWNWYGCHQGSNRKEVDRSDGAQHEEQGREARSNAGIEERIGWRFEEQQKAKTSEEEKAWFASQP